MLIIIILCKLITATHTPVTPLAASWHYWGDKMEQCLDTQENAKPTQEAASAKTITVRRALRTLQAKITLYTQEISLTKAND